MRTLALFGLFLGLIFLLMGITYRADSSWQKDAGLIPSYTQNAKITVSSNPTAASKILDGQVATHWQSEAALPHGFLNRLDLNIFLNKTEKRSHHIVKKAIDGDLNTSTRIEKEGKTAQLRYHFEKSTTLFSLALKARTEKIIHIYVTFLNGQRKSIATYQSTDNFQFKRWDLDLEKIELLELVSDASFELFELGGLADSPKEYVLIDFGESRRVGTIYTKHWAGKNTVSETNLYLSNDQKNWKKVGALNPENVFVHITNVVPKSEARFLKLEHTLLPKDWNKVSVWEIKVYDENGHYGKRPSAQPSSVTFSELLGVNGYWGWGHRKCSDRLSEGEGVEMFQTIISHARNYHDMTWDVKQPGEKIDFEKMTTKGGTPAKEWLNWDREYKAWISTGINVQASVQFYGFKQEKWENPTQAAYEYGHDFAHHFGVKEGNGYICTMEIGNEPWEYEAPLYRSILLGMAQGAKEADPTIEVFPCALQAADPSMEDTPIFKNYMGARISEAAIPYLDGINLHSYSYVTDFFGKRKSVHPEQANSSFWEILNAIRWRNQNMPGKKIYLSEWGWDSDGVGETCPHSECVSEKAAALYAIRGALIAWRLGLDRATWYYFSNTENKASLYGRSGLVGSTKTNFQKKQAFYALEQTVQLIGDQYFIKTIQEDAQMWMYLLGDAKGNATHLIAWCPVDGDVQKKTWITYPFKKKPKTAFLLDGSGARAALPIFKNGHWQCEIGAVPVVFQLGN